MSIIFNRNLTESAKFPINVTEADSTTSTNWVTYEEFVCNLVKELGALQNNIAHMALGIAGETGEIVDAIKKNVIYDKPLDVENVIEELGDLEFYMAGLRQLLGISRWDTLQANIFKLQKRYATGYSDEAAIARADKQEPEVAEKQHTPGQAINSRHDFTGQPE